LRKYQAVAVNPVFVHSC